MNEVISDSIHDNARRSTKTERVDRVLERILEGDEFQKLIGVLTPEEQNLFYDLVADLREHPDSDSRLADLWRVDYERRPPSMEQFVSDPYWLGNVLTPADDSLGGLYPVWREVLTRDFDIDSRIHNVVLTGSLGIGKTFNLVAIILYRLIIALNLRNPQGFFGLSRGSKIGYAILSITQRAVRQTAWADMLNYMSQSPYFIEECNFDPRKKYASLAIALPKDIFLTGGSRGQHVLGLNIMAAALDEGNFRLEANPDTKAYELYNEVRVRIQNRFQRTSTFLPFISLIASSARDESSFTEQVIREIDTANDKETQRVYRFSVYHVKRHRVKYLDRWFKVAYGLKNQEPFVLKGWYNDKGEKIEGEAHENPPAAARTELVPEDFYTAFVRNIKVALQSHSGISTGGSQRLFSSMIYVDQCAELAEASGLRNPCTIPMIPLSEEDDQHIWNFLDHPRFLTRQHSIVLPLRHPDAPRFAHIDLATTSMAGVSICHPVGRQMIDGLVKDGRAFSEYRTVVEYDMILTIISGRSKPISIEKIQTFFFWLRDKCGFRFALITYDQWGSQLPLQMLESRGFNAKNLSVDRTKAPYYAFRTGCEELRVRLFPQSQLWREFENLLDLDAKVDHPPEGSKDTSDSVVGAYFNAVTDTDTTVASQSYDVSAMVHGGDDTEERPLIDIPINIPPAPPRTFNA